jgi:uncharacterized protein involved in tolerance to divalent cations
MAKKVVKTFNAKEEQLAHAKFANENDLAVCIKLVPDTASIFWVEKHLISDYKNMQFLRIDQTKKDTPNNRQVFNQYDGMEKCFEMYKMYYESKNKK